VPGRRLSHRGGAVFFFAVGTQKTLGRPWRWARPGGQGGRGGSRLAPFGGGSRSGPAGVQLGSSWGPPKKRGLPRMKRGVGVQRVQFLERGYTRETKKFSLASLGRISEFFERSGKWIVFAWILWILWILGAFFILRGADPPLKIGSRSDPSGPSGSGARPFLVPP